jgi:HSP20 family protein
MKPEEQIIHNKLRDLRKEHDLSQEELADSLGISRQSIIALEQGKYMPSLPLVVSMCQFFDSAFEEIFDFEREIDQMLNENTNPIKIISNSHPINLGEGKETEMPRELGPWRPFGDTVTLRDAMDRLFEDSVVTPTMKMGGMPKINVKETKDSVVVKAELPGVAEEDITVEVADNVMTISGEKKEEKEEKDEGFYHKEMYSGSFSRSFTLPSEVKSEKAEAEMDNGVLTVSVPKVAPKQAAKIAVKKKPAKK